MYLVAHSLCGSCRISSVGGGGQRALSLQATDDNSDGVLLEVGGLLSRREDGVGTGVQERDKLPTGLVSGGTYDVGKERRLLSPALDPSTPVRP